MSDKLKPDVKIFETGGNFLGELCDENVEDVLEIIKDHIENGNIIVINSTVSSEDIDIF